MKQRPDRKTVLWLCALLLGVGLVYANHFHNEFHFDDWHTIVNNPYIRELRNIPRFFTDAHTFSVLPRNRAWRPLVSASLAIDYWLAGAFNPAYFHASTFFWFLLQLVLMYALFRRVCDLSRPDPRNRWVALFAAAWFGLHPAMAETVNYIIQRGEVYSTLGVVAALWIYAAAPRLRTYGLYLLPFAAAVISKPPALVFPAILFVYIRLFEEDDFRGAIRRCVPSLLAAAALGLLSAAMTPKEFNPGVVSAYDYRITQPLVAFRFFRTLFSPDALSADSDHRAVHSIWQAGAWAGCLFLLAVTALAIACSRRRDWRPAAFGFWWFLLGFLPAAILPVNEVENDHRMFFPFVGLVLGVCWVIASPLMRRRTASRRFSFAVAGMCAFELAFCALATMQRNLVWRAEESLWRDVTVKSPRNGRGLMNYAVTQRQKNRSERALAYLNQATIYMPFDSRLEANLGAVKGDIGIDDEAEAERHFLRAIKLDPFDPGGHDIYARWLERHGRWKETLDQLRLALTANPDVLDTYSLLMEFYAKRGLWPETRRVADNVLSRFPSDPDSRAYLLMVALETTGLAAADAFTKSVAKPESLLHLSALYFEAGKFKQSVQTGAGAIRLRPNYPEAYNNMAAGYAALGDWDQAIQASREALRIRPGYRMAIQNLARSEGQKKRSMAP